MFVSTRLSAVIRPSGMAFSLAGSFSGRTPRFERSQDGSIPSPTSNIPVEHGGCATLSYGGGRWFKSTRRDHHLIAFAAKQPDRKLSSRIRSYDGAQIARKCLSLISIAISSGFVHQLGRLFVEQENSGQHREPGPLRGPQVLFDLELLHRAPSCFNPPPSTGSKSGAYHANPNP